MKSIKKNGVGLLAVAAVTVVLALSAQAATVTLTDNGSTALVDLDSAAGMSQWTVTGLPQGMENQLNQQWFWYRIGGGLPQPINTISPASYDLFHPANQVTATYANNDISVSITYTLRGGGIGQADISEGIILQNKQSTPIDFHFYQYSDFNLLNIGSGDSVAMDSGGVVQWKGETQISESIVAPEASHFEANYVGISGNTLDKFVSTSGLNLSDNPSAGPGDVTWAYQWDFLGIGTASIQKDKLVTVTIIPEPSALALLSLGLGGILALRRRA